MSQTGHGPSDYEVEQVIGNFLRVGVIVAAAVVLCGAMIYLTRHAGTSVNYHVFRGEPQSFRSLAGIWREVLRMRGRGIIQFGLVLLIATPIIRVLLALVAFILQRDRIYIAVTTIVLAVLAYSLIWGRL